MFLHRTKLRSLFRFVGLEKNAPEVVKTDDSNRKFPSRNLDRNCSEIETTQEEEEVIFVVNLQSLFPTLISSSRLNE